MAAKRDTSISALVVGSLEELVRGDDEDEDALLRELDQAREGYDLGSHGRLGIRRDELHDR